MVLRQNNSQNAGCMRRSPASHCCQVRQVVCKSSAAAVCESPDASRAARTSSGVGFRAGLPARLRFGWLVIKVWESGLPKIGVVTAAPRDGVAVTHLGVVCLDDRVGPAVAAAKLLVDAARNGKAGALAGEKFGGAYFAFAGEDGDTISGVGQQVVDVFHGFLQPLNPEARLWRIHTPNNTRIARNAKGFRKINFRGRIKPSNV